MEVRISSRHVTVSDQLRTYVTEKVGRLERKLGAIDTGDVHFNAERSARTTARQTCEVILTGNGHSLRAKVAASDPFTAVDLVVGKLEHQLHRQKTRAEAIHHGAQGGVRKSA